MRFEQSYIIKRQNIESKKARIVLQLLDGWIRKRLIPESFTKINKCLTVPYLDEYDLLSQRNKSINQE